MVLMATILDRFTPIWHYFSINTMTTQFKKIAEKNHCLILLCLIPRPLQRGFNLVYIPRNELLIWSRFMNYGSATNLGFLQVDTVLCVLEVLHRARVLPFTHVENRLHKHAKLAQIIPIAAAVTR
jgi:hypothetical protein